MSVAFEPRNFIHDGGYPPIGDDHDHDHTADQRFTDNDVAEQLSQYTTEASMLPDSTGVLGDDRGMMPDDGSAVHDATRLDLGHPSFPSPIEAAMQAPTLEGLTDDKDLSPSIDSPPPARVKPIAKPEREAVKGVDGKFHCTQEDCQEEIRVFSRKCEWNKHMDKHERPYRCPAEGCENLPGFTYSGGLLRHEREVHGKHGGPKNTVNCPHLNCKRHTGKGFSRMENLNEHLRRVHTNPEGTGATPPPDMAVSDENDSEQPGMKRKRRASDTQATEEITELREEVKRLREENDKLKAEMQQQSQHSLAMMAQIAELQDTLRDGLTHHGLGAPTAQMI
ncbi:fungal specific transcription factor [Fusarium longipes]|uniref:Fungal specific transcription factor n=1 Tax=Fusarium longipes TaxID=694270 RepID=A0A395SUC5_9HYPO|nr:fungal specific transcription factor [Fusarium longipes]